MKKHEIDKLFSSTCTEITTMSFKLYTLRNFFILSGHFLPVAGLQQIHVFFLDYKYHILRRLACRYFLADLMVQKILFIRLLTQ